MKDLLEYVSDEQLIEYVSKGWSLNKDLANYIIQYRVENKELLKVCVEKDSYFIQYIPKVFHTEEIADIQVKTGSYISDIRADLMTYKRWAIACCANALNLHDVPKEYLTNELFKLVLENDSTALQFLNSDQVTEEFCNMAVEHSYIGIYHVYGEFRTPEMLLKAVSCHGMALDRLHDEEETLEICKAAVKNHPEAFKYIKHPEFKTRELAIYAILKCPEMIDYAVDPDDELKKFACENGYLIKGYIPSKESIFIGLNKNIKLYEQLMKYNIIPELEKEES